MSFGTSGFERWLWTCYSDTDCYTCTSHLNLNSHRSTAYAHRYAKTTDPDTDLYPGSPHSHAGAHFHTKTAYPNADGYADPGPHSYSCTHCHTDPTSANTDSHPEASNSYS